MKTKLISKTICYYIMIISTVFFNACGKKNINNYQNSFTPNAHGVAPQGGADSGGAGLLKSLQGEVEDILLSKDVMSNDLVLILNNINSKVSLLDISDNERKLLVEFAIRINLANNYFKNNKQKIEDDDRKVEECFLKDAVYFEQYFINRSSDVENPTASLEPCKDNVNDNKFILLDNIPIKTAVDEKCKDLHGNEKAGSVTEFGYNAEICISILDLQNISSGDLMRQTLALFLHELAHVVGYLENDAKTIQQIIFNEFDVLFDFKNIASSHYKSILKNIEQLKKILKSTLAGKQLLPMSGPMMMPPPMAPMLMPSPENGPFTLATLAKNKKLYADIKSMSLILESLETKIMGSFADTKSKNKRNLKIDEINSIQVIIAGESRNLRNVLLSLLSQSEQCESDQFRPECIQPKPLYEHLTEYKKALLKLETIYLKYDSTLKMDGTP